MGATYGCISCSLPLCTRTSGWARGGHLRVHIMLCTPLHLHLKVGGADGGLRGIYGCTSWSVSLQPAPESGADRTGRGEADVA